MISGLAVQRKFVVCIPAEALKLVNARKYVYIFFIKKKKRRVCMVFGIKENVRVEVMEVFP